MKRNYVAAIVVVIGLMGCAVVNPDKDEKTGPKVVFRQGGSTIDDLFLNPDKDTPPKFGPKSIACVATDPGGVKSISLSYSDTAKLCVYSGPCGAEFTPFCIGTGGPISPSMPGGSATSHPDSSGQVPSELFVESTLNEAAYECSSTRGGKTVRGQPYGQTITATCSATNYSGKTSTATLPVTFNPPSEAPCCNSGPCNCVGSSSTAANVCCAGYVCQSDGSCKKTK